MKKILILANHDVGLYNFRKELIERLLEEKYKVIISLPYGKKVDLLVDMGCQFIETPIERHGTNPIQDLKLLNLYKRILKKEKPDVVLTYTIKPTIYGGMACSFLKIPYIVNITGLGTAVENPGLLQNITISLYKKALKNVQCVFFQNEENRQFFIDRKIAMGKHQLLPGSGVNLEEFKVLSYPDDDTIHFLFIARVMKEKGIDQYLETAKVIKKEYPQTHFHVLGFCEEDYKDILDEYQDKGIIEYHGLQSDVREFHKIAHCTIHPSYYPEGMSNVLLESAACGRPIITTDRSGCREIVDDGETGFIVPIKDSQSLIEAVKNFLSMSNEKREEMGLKGREKVEREFDRQIVVNKYIEEIM